MWKIAESSEGDLKAWRGNGAENSSECKGREGSGERKAAPIQVTPNGVHAICPLVGREGRAASKPIAPSSEATCTPTSSSLTDDPFPPSFPNSLDYKTGRQNLVQHWLFLKDSSVYCRVCLTNAHLLCTYYVPSTIPNATGKQGSNAQFLLMVVHRAMVCSGVKNTEFGTGETWISFQALALLAQGKFFFSWKLPPIFLSIKLG